MMMKLCAASAAVALCAPVMVNAGISDFYVADADGIIFAVNGQTLHATQIHTMVEDGIGVNEIHFQGNGNLLVNVTGGVVEYNINTNTESIVFTLGDHIDHMGGFSYMTGLAMASTGDVFFTAQTHTASGVSFFGATYNFSTDTYTQLADWDLDLGLYFDHHEVSPDVFLAADFSGQRVTVTDSITGERLASYSTAVGFVSFFETDGLLLAMTKSGDLYEFDADDGTSIFYGSISGATNSMIGATVPSPGSIPILGMAALFVARRRR